MNDLGAFLVMLLAFTGAAVTILWTIVAAIGRVKRMRGTPGPGQFTPEEIEAIRAWLAEQDHRDVRLEQLEERLDFVERVLGRTREQQQLGNPSE
jgi:mono/diheme cytochrome c family protein